ncbi:MAG: hypothetical protein ACXIT9_10875 [Nitritalea sp.]
MKELSVNRMEMVSGGSWACAGALLGSASSILGLAAGAALTTGPAAPAVVGGLFIGHMAANLFVLDACIK